MGKEGELLAVGNGECTGMDWMSASVTRTALTKQPIPDTVLFLFILLRLPQQLYITEHLEIKSIKPFW